MEYGERPEAGSCGAPSSRKDTRLLNRDVLELDMELAKELIIGIVETVPVTASL